MVVDKNTLLAELEEMTNAHIQYAKSLQEVSDEKLQWRSSKKSWSILECLEHLNRYALFYNMEIRKRITAAKDVKEKRFISGCLGNRFAVDMLPKEKMKKIRTFKSKNPINAGIHKTEVLSNFIALQEELLVLLILAKEKDITAIKTNITLPFIKFRLGDTFRFVIYHNERHITQAKGILYKKSSQ
ncbi:DinB family protein [Tenacibaculum sp. nBUS_03]|uniref:DinB family protein n=1 Tax=Tenacibaculum sp. nBUS_03 TaxID=3395320 RepID=UPI003EB967AE